MNNIKSVSPEFVADIATNLLVEVAKSGKILFFNTKAACVFANIRKPGVYLKNVVAADDFRVLMQNIDTALYQQYPHHFYWMQQDRFYLVYVYPKDDSVWLAMEDITEKRRQAHLLYLSAQRMMFAERIAQLGYWELDIALKRFYWSDEMYRIFGIKDKSKTYHRNLIRELLHPDDLGMYKQKLKELIGTHRDIKGDARIVTYEGELKYCRFMAGIIYESGEPKIAGAFQDISDLVKAQHQLIDAKKAADEANLAKSYFLAQASHDIRQPLQAMDLFIEGLKNAPAEKYPELAEKLSVLSRNLTGLVNNFLDVSKLDSGGMVFKAQNFDLGELVARICDEYKEMAAEKGIFLSCRLKNVLINQDVFLVERILRNLLSNALKYAKTKIRVGNTKNSFWVIDDGCGIDKNKQKHIFKAFYQCDTLSDRRRGGAGLGLNIVEKIAEVIGAKIRLKSKLKCYSAFEVRI